MAKIIKSCNLIFNPTPVDANLNKVVMRYTTCLEEDESMQSYKEIEIVLTGADLTAAQDLFNLAISEAESAEGIV